MYYFTSVLNMHLYACYHPYTIVCTYSKCNSSITCVCRACTVFNSFDCGVIALTFGNASSTDINVLFNTTSPHSCFFTAVLSTEKLTGGFFFFLSFSAVSSPSPYTFINLYLCVNSVLKILLSYDLCIHPLR